MSFRPPTCAHPDDRIRKIRSAAIVYGYPGATCARYRCEACGGEWDDPTERPADFGGWELIDVGTDAEILETHFGGTTVEIEGSTAVNRKLGGGPYRKPSSPVAKISIDDDLPAAVVMDVSGERAEKDDQADHVFRPRVDGAELRCGVCGSRPETRHRPSLDLTP
jgi:hypothetical protein